MIYLVKIFIPKGFRGITLYPFIFIKNKNDLENLTFINHEKIHLKQQTELLILPFYIWYGIEYLIRRVQYKNKRIAYRNISFEREAYQNEADLNYLQKRNFWSFLKYM